MQKYFAVLISDQISKDGTSFSVSALEDMVWLTALYGVPSNISHDMHRSIGWTYSKGLFFDYHKTLVIGHSLIGETNKDFEQIKLAKQNYINNLMHKSFEPFREDFISELGKLMSEKNNFFFNNLALYKKPQILFEAFPKIKDAILNDRDKLISIEILLDSFDYLGHGVFKDKSSNLAILAHPFFRKSLSHYNNFHHLFLDELVNLHKTEDVSTKINLDLDYIGFAPSFNKTFEYEYWWGPQYNDNISDIALGLCVYKSDENERFYYNLDRTEFFWKSGGKLHEFELEEIKEEEAPTLEDTYACRYIHSIYDKEKKMFDHFDGAIRGYSTELMLERISSKLTEFGRRSDYTKLFRVDKNLSLAKWKYLITTYMQGNPQIYEYFNLPKPNNKLEQINNQDKSVKEKYIPYSINKNDGIRMFVSYHPKLDHKDKERYVSITDSINWGDTSFNTIELFTVEIKKALNRLGQDLELPSDCKFISPEDYYINIPCIYHSSNNTQESINYTIEAIQLITDSLVKKSDKEILSFTLAWDIEDKEIRISIMGHVSDISNWLKQTNTIPVKREKLKEWLNKQQVYFQKNGKDSQTPTLEKIIQDDGVLYLKRRSISRDVDFEMLQNSDTKFKIQFSEDQDDLKKALEDKEILISPAMIIEEISCSKTQKNYIESPYSIVLDDDVTQNVDKFELLAFHWTDKSRYF